MADQQTPAIGAGPSQSTANQQRLAIEAGPSHSPANQSSDNTRQQQSASSSSSRDRAQMNEITRILNSPPTEFYTILNLPSGGSTPSREVVTRAFKKGSLLVHPDKQIHPTRQTTSAQAFQKLKEAAERLGGDIELGANFHHSAYTGDDSADNDDNETGSILVPHQDNREGQPTLTDFVQQIYNQATPTMKRLMKNAADQDAIRQLERFNQQIREHNQTHDMPAEDRVIEYSMLRGHYDTAAPLVRNLEQNSADNLSKNLLRQINDVLKEALAQRSYPSTWLVDDPSQAHVSGSSSNQGQAPPAASSSNQGQAPAAGSSSNQGQTPSAATSSSSNTNMTREGSTILGWRQVGRLGRQYLVREGTEEYPRFTLRSKEGDDGIGRRAGTQYESSAGAVQLGQADCRFRKEDANRYRGIKAYASKGFQVRSVDVRDRFPVGYALATFVNPTEEHWLTRTTLRFILGKRDADDDIREWHQVNDVTPASEIPSAMILIPNPASASNSTRQEATPRQEPVNTGTERTPQPSGNPSQQERVASPVSYEELQREVNTLKSEMLDIKALLQSINERLGLASGPPHVV